MAVVSSNTLEAALTRAVQQEAERIYEESIQEAVRDYESKLRQVVLKSAIDLTSFYDIARDGENLVLTVRHMDPRK